MESRRRSASKHTLPVGLFVFATLLLFSPASIRAEVSVYGSVKTVKDLPVADVRIVILETKQQTRTDNEGRFILKFPEPGYYTLRIIKKERIIQLRQHIEYENQKVILRIEDSTQTSFVEPESGIHVVGKRDPTKLSRYTLTNDEIKRLPGVYGDSLKAVGTLPGVLPTPPPGVLPSVNPVTAAGFGEFSLGAPYSNSRRGQIVLRGAGARASTFYLDGFIIQYPFHMGDQSSVLNNDLIRSVDVYTGTFPTRFGNTTGGVISITGPEEVKKPSAHLNIATFLADAYYESPLLNGNGYVVATGRHSYPNYTLLKTYPDAIPDNAKYASYYDGQFKIGWRPAPGHTLTMIYFGARDILAYSKSVSDATREGQTQSTSPPGSMGDLNGYNSNEGDTRPPVGMEKSFHTQGIRYVFHNGGWIRNNIQLQVSRYKEDFELDFRSPFTGETIFGFNILDARQELRLSDEVNIELFPKHAVLNLGMESSSHRMELSMKNLSPRKSINPNTPDFVETINELIDNNRTFRALHDGDRTRFHLNAGFAELEIEAGPLRITPGVRLEHYTLSNARGVGPRMGLEYNIKSTSTILMAGAGRHFNIPTSLELISIEAGNPHLEMEQADHMAAGIEQKLGKEWIFKFEGYRNIFNNLVTSDRWIVEPWSLRTNKRDLVEIPSEIRSDPFENRPLYYSNDGTGESRGIEMFLKKSRDPGKKGWFGWISYGWSLTKRNNHQTRLSQDEQDELFDRNLNRDAVAYFEQDHNTFIYYDTGELEYYPDNDRPELYDYDRTHIVSLVLNYRFDEQWQTGFRWRYMTNVPHTPVTGTEEIPISDIIGRMTFIPEYSDFYNSARLGPFHQLDIRIDRFLNYEWGYANLYVEFINFYARRNPESENFSFLYPYVKGFNPSVTYESTYMETPIGKGKRMLIPLINAGMEIRF